MPKKRKAVDFRELAQKCLRCGLCTTVCPVHQVEADEYTAARGRNLLVNQLKGKKDFDRNFRRRFEKCLLCGSCLPQCPQGISIDLLTLGVREEMVRKKGLGLPKSLVFRFAMRDRERFGKILSTACKLQRYLPAGEGKIRHLPAFLSGLGAGRRIPEIAPVFLRNEIQEVSRPPEGIAPRRRVGLFMGCALDYLFPEIGKKMVRFLNRQGVEVVTPMEQGCCALPVIGAGDMDTAKEMALRNMAAFQNLDRVITGCATCGSALKDYDTFFHRASNGRGKLADFVEKVRDFSEFLVRDLDLSPQALASTEGWGKSLRLTYHDPCHLRRYQGITEEPRRIISSIPWVKLVEMDAPDLCCGMGGSFGLSYYETSKKIADKKAAAIQETGAEAVVTTCPGCRMQILDTLRRHGMQQRVLHIVDLLEPDEN
ncbi:MAG: (Fe-S)-binding protein [Deltaproteobacteria bacterium]|nr:(Fe-S)-binding protein [Deltaproteobacteria bacterium]